MSQEQKSAYWKALKDLGVEFNLHYREYSTEELAGMYAEKTNGATPPSAKPKKNTPAPPPAVEHLPEPGAGDTVVVDSDYLRYLQERAMAATPAPAPTAPDLRNVPRSSSPEPGEMAGQRLNSKAEDEPIRVDEAGRVWFQEEVLKPGYAKPRGRRVLRYMDSGVETKQVKNGDYVESFEVGGALQVPSEVKITLPSYQVGIYKDPRFPFKINTYNGLPGFDLDDIQEFYGGAELVPEEIRRIYVSHVLCYDIRTTIRAIETAYRQQQLSNRNGI